MQMFVNIGGYVLDDCFLSNHETIIWTVITCKKITLQKYVASRYKQKQKYFSLPGPQLAEKLIFVFDF